MSAMDLCYPTRGLPKLSGAIPFLGYFRKTCNNLQNVVAITCIFGLQQTTFLVCNFLHLYYTRNIGYCMGNEGKSVEEQIHGAIDVLESRLRMVGLTLESVVKMDCLFKDIEDLNCLPKVLKDRLGGKYPTRKAYTTNFVRDGIRFQIDAIAYKK